MCTTSNFSMFCLGQHDYFKLWFAINYFSVTPSTIISVLCVYWFNLTCILCVPRTDILQIFWNREWVKRSQICSTHHIWRYLWICSCCWFISVIIVLVYVFLFKITDCFSRFELFTFAMSEPFITSLWWVNVIFLVLKAVRLNLFAFIPFL